MADETASVADLSPRDFRRRSEFLFFLFDTSRLNSLLGVMDELNSAAGRRYVEALISAGVSGDPAALQRLEGILEDENVKPRVRRRIAGAVEKAIVDYQEQELEAAGPDVAAVAEEGAPSAEIAPIDPSVTLEAFAGQLESSDQVGFYGVDPFTMDEDGAVVPWEAIVGDATVAPQYPQGWSRQPQRFGINNEESIARAQIMMEEAGLLQPGTYRLGVWDVRTAGRSNEEGWRAVLSFANVTGQEWSGAFNQLYTAGTDASARGLRMQLERLSREPMYTDPDAMRARTRQFLRQMGRRENEITDEEVDTIMRAAAVGSQQMQIDTLQQRIDQTQMQAEGYSWNPAQAITGGMQGPLPIEPVDIDPARSFDTALEGVMGREISARQSQQEAAEGQRDFSSIAQAFGSAFSR
jgi:hypothetical protein